MIKIKNTLVKFMVVLCLSIIVTPNVSLSSNVSVVATVQAAYSKDTVYAVQKALNDNGYDCGTPDGVVGNNTKKAIKKYQKDNELKVTGTINKTLLKLLGVTEVKSSSISSIKKDSTVYITRTGAKYHRSGCRYLRQSKISISISEAKRNYDPCSVCNP
ncbi:MAG: hypothetical protein K0S61_1258 [Anaerocolumna sp.]|jgi:peptidoglycan hydrolase-like protein with peptidoglycan-binding domain|nr:hypothetical protein [Anaerocolumna sp.]